MLTRTGATLVAMAAVEAETLGWQKQGGVPQRQQPQDQHVLLQWQGQGRGPRKAFVQGASPVLAAKSASSSAKTPSAVREGGAGQSRQPKPTPTFSRPTLLRWASGGYPSTPPWDTPDDLPRGPGPRKGAATSPITPGVGPAASVGARITC